ncbi:DUF202 domain-containing protein [Streptomyces sp. NPDC048483]|uniref:DUF202 domain-containing protein n=1 Tax=Streptomyces sp. NPDC048483 TaxID=3154927 RepID=UPI003415E31D
MSGTPRPDPRARPPAPDRDPGLQPERTRLAWRRTTLSCTVVAVLAGRQLGRSAAPGPVVAVLTALTALVWLAFVALAHHRVREMTTGRPPDMPPRTALLLVSCTLALAAFGAAMVVA